MQFIDLGAQYRRIKEQVDREIISVLEGGKFIMGPQVKSLEKRLAEYVGRRHCVTCSNGTDALTMALMAYGVGKGDAVFVPDFTFFASAETVAAVGATPIFVDVCRETFNIDTKKLEDAVIRVKSEGRLNPKMVVAVDLFGQPADYAAIERTAKHHNLTILEDGAQGFGGTMLGRRVCSFGDISATSFFPAKPLGCYGDGGAVFTDSDEIYELLCSIRVHGSDPWDKYNNVRIGLNARLDTVQAAVLHCKMDIFDDELKRREDVAEKYTKGLSDIVETPVIPHGFTSSFAQYTVKLGDRIQRDRTVAELRERRIPAMVYYPRPMHLQTAFASLGGKPSDFPVSENLCDTVMSLPMHPYLSDGDIDTVCTSLREIL